MGGAWITEVTSRTRVTFGTLLAILAILGSMYAMYLGDFPVMLGGIFVAAIGIFIAKGGKRRVWREGVGPDN